MLYALGFPRKAVFTLFLGEYGALVLMGIVVGGVAAAIAMAPAVTSSASNVSATQLAAVLGLVALSGFGCVLLALGIGLRNVGVDALRTE